MMVKAMEQDGAGRRGLSPYAAMLWFELAVLASTFVYSVPLMSRPLTGEPPVRLRDYVDTVDSFSHLLGWLGGAAWAVGTTANVVGGGSIGFAVSYALGQTAPVVASLWGLLVWREFDGAPLPAKAALAGVFAFYFGAIACVAMSK